MVKFTYTILAADVHKTAISCRRAQPGLLRFWLLPFLFSFLNHYLRMMRILLCCAAAMLDDTTCTAQMNVAGAAVHGGRCRV